MNCPSILKISGRSYSGIVSLLHATDGFLGSNPDSQEVIGRKDVGPIPDR